MWPAPEKLTSYLIAGLVAIVMLELASLAALRMWMASYQSGEAFPVPSGYSVDYRYVPPVARPCYLIRVTADTCPYCDMDKPQYSGLVGHAQTAGCGLLAVAPRVGLMSGKKGDPEVPLQYVDMRLGRAIRSSLTPQTLLLDRNGRVVWQRQGAMRDLDLTLALDALGALR